MILIEYIDVRLTKHLAIYLDNIFSNTYHLKLLASALPQQETDRDTWARVIYVDQRENPRKYKN